MDYYDWVAGQLGKAPSVIDWKDIPAEDVSDPNLTTHSGTVRQTWVGDKVMMCEARDGTTNVSWTESTTKDNAVQLVTWAESTTKDHSLRSGVLFVSKQ